MTFTEEIAQVLKFELELDGDIDKERLYKNLLIVMDKNRQHVDALGSQLHRLIGEETALTLPLADGCVAKVRFSMPVTKSHMMAFANMFQAIAEHYVAPEVTP